MRDLAIAYGRSRQALTWVNKKIRFADLKERLKVTIRTPESVEEYAKMSRAQRDAAKDHGGFVAGVLIGGRRKMDTVELRSMIALDGDKIDQDFLDNYESIMPYTSALYTTHSSTEENPRARIVIPATRDMTPEEFVAVTRYVAQSLGIDFFDECSYQPNQLMYWPSTPANGTFVYKETDGAWLNPDTILAAHPEWRDPMRLPTSSRESKANTTSQRKAQDPLTKEGAVGLFNRTYYPITTALDTFLSDIYEPTDRDNRYHLIEASSMAGVEVIEDKFVYSHHAKDPAYLQLCNAFDIVRIHRFGDLGEKESYKAMCAFAMQQESVRLLATNERLADASEEFTAEDGESWKAHLELDRSGAIKNTLGNLTLILQNDPALKSIGFNQLADGMEIRGPVPWKHPAKFWRDADDAQLISYIDSHYGNFSARNYDIAITKVTDDRSYHPIHEMFESLPEWDHVERVDTLLIDYLGAQDNEYTRAITRKILCAAYRRVYEPGVKFDYAVVLNGPQGIGKSTLIAHLGMEWFSDSLSLSDMNDKTAAEKLQGYWIMEIGELAGMKKADIDKVKAFISRQDDKYRASFGRRVTPHLRQCVFFGTTNSDNGYLRDVTGNRRFWNVKVTGEGKWKPWDLDTATVQQIWAETVVYAKAGERLFLSPELEEYAREEQREALEMDDREGIVSSFKNHQSKRFKALMQVRPKIKRVVGLTGTPASNGLMDLWAEFKIIDLGQRLGRLNSQYRQAYFTPDRMNGPIVYSYRPLPGAEEEIYDQISDITISMKSTDHLRMPELISSEYKVFLNDKERKAYDRLKQDLILDLPDKEITAANAAALSGKLCQLANGALYADSGEIATIHSRKLDALEDLIEAANGKPLLVAYWYRHDLDRITERLHERHIPFSRLDSAESIKRWNRGELPVALIHPASAGHGLNLQSGGNAIVWYGMTWSLELYQQTIGRLWRQGQTAETVVVQHIITAGTIDENILLALRAKDRTQAALIAAVKADLKI